VSVAHLLFEAEMFYASISLLISLWYVELSPHKSYLVGLHILFGDGGVLVVSSLFSCIFFDNVRTVFNEIREQFNNQGIFQ
jgi:hypothetical protein